MFWTRVRDTVKRWFWPAASPAPQPPPSTSGPAADAQMPPGNVVGGMRAEDRETLDGIEVEQLRQRVEQVLFDNGVVLDGSTRALVRIGDGSIVRSLEGLGTCQLCAAEASERAQGLHHRPALAVTLSGICVCAKHRRLIRGSQGRDILVTTLEAEELEHKARLQRPVKVALRLLLEPPDAQRDSR